MAVVIAGTVTINPDNHDEILAAAIDVMEGTRAEDGCIEYVFSADPQDRGVLRLFEKWEHIDNLGPHMKAPHVSVWREKCKELGVTGSDITIYEVASESKL